MALIRVNLDFTATSAEKVADLNALAKHNLGVAPEDARPFSVVWPKTGMREEASRFVLPAFVFEGRTVARFGFRNKDGFMVVSDALPQQVQDAAASRFQRLIAIAKNNALILQEERASMRDEVHRVFGIRIPADTPAMGGPRRYMAAKQAVIGLTPIDIWNAVETMKTDNIRGFWENGKMRVEVLRAAHNLSHPVFSVVTGNSGTVLFADYEGKMEGAVDAVTAAHTRALEAVNFGAMNADLRRAGMRFNGYGDLAQAGRVRMAKMKSGDVLTHDGFSLKIAGGALLLMRDAVVLAQLGKDGRPRSMASGLGRSGNLHSGVMAVACRICENNPIVPRAEVAAEKTAADPPKDWMESLETAVRSTDFGYF